MSTTLIFVHSVLRWVVLLALTAFLVSAVRASAAERSFVKRDDKLAIAAVIALDLQLLVGLALYGAFSPTTKFAFANMKVAMKDAGTRFFVAEHLVIMLLAVVTLHVGRVRAKRLGDAPARHSMNVKAGGLTFLLVILGIPWPFLPYARALIPMLPR